MHLWQGSGMATFNLLAYFLHGLRGIVWIQKWTGMVGIPLPVRKTVTTQLSAAK
jgi:hypothetical protein